MGLKVGIMADSHGDAGKIGAAISFLKDRGCGVLFHLGDICDSYHLDETAACIRLLQENRVQAIKGNNDHVITRFHASRDGLDLKPNRLAWLNHLPLVRDYRNAVFTHSLPFEKELGLSCMIRPMDHTQALLFFKRYPDRVLFRGHSHDPEIITPELPDIGSYLPLEVPIDLTQNTPCIITCGALMENLCAIWQPEKQLLTSIQF